MMPKSCLALALLTPLLLAGCGGSHHATTPPETTRDTTPPAIYAWSVSSADASLIQISQDSSANLPAQRIPIVGPTVPLIVSVSITDNQGLDTAQPPQAVVYSANGQPFAYVPLAPAPRDFDKNFWQGQAALQQDLGAGVGGLKTVVVEARDTSGNKTTIPVGTFFYGTRDNLTASIPQPLPPFTSTPVVETGKAAPVSEP